MNKKLYSALYSCVSTDYLRPRLMGIYHKDRYITATDGMILATVKQDYPEDLEGKIIGINGKEIEGNYSDYKKVIPYISGLTKIEDDYIYNNLEFACKLSIKKEDWPTCLIEIGGMLLSTYFLKKAFRLVRILDERLTIYVPSEDYRAIVFKTSSMACVIMPCRRMDNNNFYTIEEALTCPVIPKPKKWYE